MSQSSSLHVAIIMDGNGRWAERRGLSRTAGHRAGARTIEMLVDSAPGLGISVLTLYAFSSDNWNRPMPEVAALMRLFRSHLRTQRDRAIRDGVAVEVIGRRDRLPDAVVREIEATEGTTWGGTRLRLRLAVDYSARDAILRAAQAAPAEGALSREAFSDLVARADNGRPVPAVDVLVRTGGERRLSDFLLWESAYAELFFLETMWPEFSAVELGQVVSDFQRRERRFGAVPARANLRLTR